ncbi:MAG: GNAT family N-acetyltransferase [Parvibaculaceae bacterium]
MRPKVHPDLKGMKIRPLTPDRWPDLLDLFGPERGANSGCWCMWTRVSGKDWKAMTRGERRDAFHRIVKKGPPPGLIAYRGKVPVGWVAIGPRPSVSRFNGAKTSRPPEKTDEPAPETVHAISCFYIRSGHRGQGLMRLLGEAAVAFAARAGAGAVDVCAIEPEKRLQWGEGFVGLATVFRALGFREIARRSPKRPLMRRNLP